MERTPRWSTGSFKEENQWWEDVPWDFQEAVKKDVEVDRDRKQYVETGKRLLFNTG